MRYGTLEFAYAEPFANALAVDPQFRSWVLSRTKFASRADGCRLLDEEMKARRSSVSTNWWRSHFTERCRCAGCSGQETDLLAIFEAADRSRFAVHFEVKQPTDKFPKHKDQAGNYAIRAACWAAAAPAKVLPHTDATTVLLCNEMKLREYAPHIAKFGAVLTFEEIGGRFPHATSVTVLAGTPASAPAAPPPSSST